MTVAVDPRTGRVIGQVLEPRGVTEECPPTWQIAILTKDGATTVPRASVRLEEV